MAIARITDPRRLLGVVVGNGFTKGIHADGEFVFQSVIATETAGISFEGFKAAKDFIIGFEDQSFAIGETVGRLGNIPVTAMDRSRVGTPFYRTLLAAAMVRSGKESGPLALILTMPLNWYEERDSVKDLLAGEYRVIYQGREYTYTLTRGDIRIVPEGFGVLCDQYLDDQGCTIHGQVATARIGVVEIGTATTDLSFFESLNINPKRSTGLKWGLSEIWRAIQADINKDYRREFTLHEIDQIVNDGAFKHNGKPQDVERYIKRHMPGLANVIMNEINQRWDGGAAADYIFVAGGGCPKIYPFFEYPHAAKVAKPYIADARGIYKYGLLKIRKGAGSGR